LLRNCYACFGLRQSFLSLALSYIYQNLFLELINSDSKDLPWQSAVVRFPTGHPSSALSDTDGRHDRTGHGTWMLLAVFVARDDRPWLSVTGTCGAGFGLFAPGMDPRACDGWTTVCPLWLLSDPLLQREFFGSRQLQASAVKFLHRELFRVDSVETANVEHHHIPVARAFAVGIRLNPAGLAERVMNPAVVKLILGRFALA
jgi:hypothetical protein